MSPPEKRKLLMPEKLKCMLLTPSRTRMEKDGRTGKTLYALSGVEGEHKTCEKKK